jgi:hypothetical protein
VCHPFNELRQTSPSLPHQSTLRVVHGVFGCICGKTYKHKTASVVKLGQNIQRGDLITKTENDRKDTSCELLLLFVTICPI